MTNAPAPAGMATCACVNVEFGSYDSYVELFAPDHLTRDDGRGVCVDACLALEITKLWKAGIHTTGCCCGHGRLEPTICVAEDSVVAMEAMGYVRSALPTAVPAFTAKTGWPFAAQPSAGAEHVCEWRLIAETQDAQYVRVTAMIDAAKEAGWAMMDVVDSIAWESRQRFSDTSARLARTIEAVETGSATPVPSVEYTSMFNYTHPAPVQPDSGGGVEALREKIVRIVGGWAFDVAPPRFKDSKTKAAMRESAYALTDRILAALAPVAAEGGEKGITVSDEMVETACSRFVSESDDIWPVSVWPESPYDDGSRGDQDHVRLLSDDDQHNVRAAMRLALTDALSALRTEPTGGGRRGMSVTADEKILNTDLFAGDFGDPGDRSFSNKMVVAAKPHQCGHCKGPIAKGERHRCFVEMFDGEMVTGRCCAECCTAMVKDYDEDDIEHMEARIDLHDPSSPYSTARSALTGETGGAL